MKPRNVLTALLVLVLAVSLHEAASVTPPLTFPAVEKLHRPVVPPAVPETTESHGELMFPAEAFSQAVRLAPPAIVQTGPPPVPTGLYGQPFAPEGLDDCAEMTFYRKQAGLPATFDRIGWRESRCQNSDTVKTFCCHGYWQMWTTLHMKDHRLNPKMAACSVASHHDLNSDDPLEKQKQACAAKALYDTVGDSAWSATR